MMTTTLNDMTWGRPRPSPATEAKALAELVRLTKEQGLSTDRPRRLLTRPPAGYLLGTCGLFRPEQRSAMLKDPQPCRRSLD